MIENKINIKEFVKANYKYLTIPDMVEETGISRYQIQYIIDQLGITPLSLKERNDNFIMDFHKSKTLAELAKAMGVQERYVSELCFKLGVKPLTVSKKTNAINPNSPSRILGEYKYERATHYVNEINPKL